MNIVTWIIVKTNSDPAMLNHSSTSIVLMVTNDADAPSQNDF